MDDYNVDACRKIACNELETPTWGVTQQFLEVNQIAMDGSSFHNDRFEVDDQEETVSFYFSVKDQDHFFVIIVSTDTMDVVGVYPESGHRCYLTATSDSLSLEELSRLTQLKYSEGWSKGDPRRSHGFYTFSQISFEFHDHQSYSLEDILSEVLTELEKDSDGVLELTINANAYIAIARYQYVSANAGISIDTNTVRRLSALNLGIDIDTYIGGEPYKETD